MENLKQDSDVDLLTIDEPITPEVRSRIRAGLSNSIPRLLRRHAAAELRYTTRLPRRLKTSTCL